MNFENSPRGYWINTFAWGEMDLLFMPSAYFHNFRVGLNLFLAWLHFTISDCRRLLFTWIIIYLIFLWFVILLSSFLRFELGQLLTLIFLLLWYLLLNFACGACDTILNWSYLFSGGHRQLDYLHKLHIQLYFPLNKGKWDALGLYCIFIIFVSLYIYYFLWFVILYLFLVIFTFYLQPWSDSALEFSTVGCVSCFLVALYLFTFHVRGIGGLFYLGLGGSGPFALPLCLVSSKAA